MGFLRNPRRPPACNGGNTISLRKTEDLETEEKKWRGRCVQSSVFCLLQITHDSGFPPIILPGSADASGGKSERNDGFVTLHGNMVLPIIFDITLRNLKPERTGNAVGA
jgi:hypothetical protein